MATFGVTAQGFVRKTLRDILNDLSSTQRATISQALDTSSDSVIGQLNGIFARELGIGWEQLEICYHGFDPAAAEYALLSIICALTGTIRRPATASEVDLDCDLDAGVTLTSGTHFAAITGKLDVRWTPKVDYTAAITGHQSVRFKNEKLGPIPGPANAIKVIATPVSGWRSVNNGSDAEEGRPVDVDTTLRMRREQELAATGSTTVRAIRAKLLEMSSAVENVTVLENDKDFADVDTGLPPHSIEAIVYDGTPPFLPANDIAQVVWNTKSAGISAQGNTSGTAIISDDGSETKIVRFSRPEVVDVYLSYTLKPDIGYVGASTLKLQIKDLCDAKFSSGQDVIAIIAEAFALSGGVKDITDFRLGRSSSPSGTTNISITLRQIPRFDTSRITITEV